MQTARLSAILVVCACALLFTGCDSQLQDLRIQNATQQKLIDQLQSELAADNLKIDQLQRQLAEAQQKGGIENETLLQRIAALEEDIAKKKELIASLQQKVLFGGAALPVELSTMLEDFAKGSDMISYDAGRGVVRFKSDLLFEKGSDTVDASAAEKVKALCTIMNSEQGKQFDIIIAGHTDDIPIKRPETRAKHPTNWHLSVHRAIAVLNVMESSSIDPKRLSARGFGEYRPIAENLAGNKGNPANRRVEIYIVAKGA